MSLKITIGSTLLVASVVSLLLMWRRRRCPKSIGKIKKLVIYPIKSLPGIEVPSLEVTKSGVQYNGWIDRGFMLIDVKTNFIVTLRQKSSLTLLKLSLKPSITQENVYDLLVESPSPEHKILELKYENEINPDMKIFENSIWGGPMIKSVDCGDEAASWFQEYLSHGNCRLVRYFSSFPLRPSNEVKCGVQQPNNEELIAYQDANAIHLINNASIDEFNTKLTNEAAISYRNFRPNIIVDSEPYIEDYWTEVQINNVLLRTQKKTDRCTIPGLNPDTGDKVKEVLDTLKKHRSAKSKEDISAYQKNPLFGIGCCVKESGIITTDDNVVVSF